MIIGMVQQFEAVIELRIHDSSNEVHEFETVIDTGYNGSLTLPANIISKLGLPSIGSRRAMLADGSEVLLKKYHATVLWHNLPHQITIMQSEGGSLLGMGLLEGCRLTIDAFEGGEVRIEMLQACPDQRESS